MIESSLSRPRSGSCSSSCPCVGHVLGLTRLFLAPGCFDLSRTQLAPSLFREVPVHRTRAWIQGWAPSGRCPSLSRPSFQGSLRFRARSRMTIAPSLALVLLCHQLGLACRPLPWTSALVTCYNRAFDRLAQRGIGVHLVSFALGRFRSRCSPRLLGGSRHDLLYVKGQFTDSFHWLASIIEPSSHVAMVEW
jgi:hypothetical protein